MSTVWETTKFGSALVLNAPGLGANQGDGVFYSHIFTEQGSLDVLAAGLDYLKRSEEDGPTRMIALYLLSSTTPDVDDYARQSLQRWRLSAVRALADARVVVRIRNGEEG
jgi:hypothetical protein